MFVGAAGKAEEPAQTLLLMSKVTQQNRSVNFSQTRCEKENILVHVLGGRKECTGHKG